jgi:hypothetical protein
MWELKPDGSTVVHSPDISLGGKRPLYSVHHDGDGTYAVGYGIMKLDASGEVDDWVVLENVASLNDIWGAGEGEMWIVGGSDHILEFDGVASTFAPREDEESTGRTWYAVHGSGPDDVWAVGSEGVSHYDGSIWSATSRVGTGDLVSVWVAEDGQAFVGAEGGYAGHYVPGSGWNSIDELDVGGDWYGVTGTSSSDVWFLQSGSVVYHYDGQDWQQVAVAEPVYGTAIRDAAASGPNDVWAVGESGSAWHYDGVAWRRVDIKCDATLLGIWMGPDGEGWAVGDTPLPGVALHRLPR